METKVLTLPGGYIRLEPLEQRHIDGLSAAAGIDPSLYQWSPVPRHLRNETICCHSFELAGRRNCHTFRDCPRTRPNRSRLDPLLEPGALSVAARPLAAWSPAARRWWDWLYLADSLRHNNALQYTLEA